MVDATATQTHCVVASTAAERRAQAQQILAFTALHQQHAVSHPAQREAALLQAQLPLWFQPLQPEDLFAGRICTPLACFSPEPGGFGYAVNQDALAALMSDAALASEQPALEAARSYWLQHSTWQRAQERIASRDAWRTKPTLAWFSEPMRMAPLFRIAGLSPDLPRLMEQGLSGLRTAAQAHATGDDEARALSAGWIQALDAVERVLAGYAVEADALGRQDIADSCRRLCAAPPRTLRDALQWALILTGAAGMLNFGRIDDAFGPFLAGEGLAEDQAVALVLGWFRLIATRKTIYNGRVIVGGRGRKHPAAADAFARIALIATRLQRDIEPQVTLRLCPEQDSSLLDLGLDALAAGSTYPMLYHDTVNIPAVQRAFRVDEATAERYTPYGCGEYTLGPASLGTPNVIINVALILHDVLHGKAPGQNGAVPQWQDIGGLWEDLSHALWLILRDGAHAQMATYEAMQDHARLLLPSLFVDGPLQCGRSLLGGGIRYLGGTMEVYGLTNAADALLAVEEQVFRKGRFSLDQLRAALAANFQGPHATIAAWLRRSEKFGNDQQQADDWNCRLHDLVCATTRNHASSVGLHHWLVVNINNWANTCLGRFTPATPDGRLAGQPLANANAPLSGADTQGPSAVLASQAKPDAGFLAGQTQNLKLSATWLRGDRGPLKALLQQYWSAGGCQLMITVSQPEELRRAMEQPQDYGHLLVRVGGFSARFVELPRDCQEEILARTLH